MKDLKMRIKVGIAGLIVFTIGVAYGLTYHWLADNTTYIPLLLFGVALAMFGWVIFGTAKSPSRIMPWMLGCELLKVFGIIAFMVFLVWIIMINLHLPLRPIVDGVYDLIITAVLITGIIIYAWLSAVFIDYARSKIQKSTLCAYLLNI
ncbi:MAG: hypothetical protein WCT08_06345 [Patescibacteria group bacterium]|jgi:hypothetical protein